VALAGGQANVCTVRSDAGIQTMKDLVAAMRARPGQFNFSSTGVGSLSHLGIELLKVKTGTFAVHIPYPSSPAAVTALLQGDVQFACVPAVAVMPQVKAGRLRALAVSTGTRSSLMPDVPTMKESGFPEVEAVAWMALLAPAQTPPEVLARMNREVNAVLQLPEVRERMHSQYMDPLGGSADQLARFMRDELQDLDADHRAQRRDDRLSAQRRGTPAARRAASTAFAARRRKPRRPAFSGRAKTSAV
jgi:tripartite-type tricarboxylate transporter receptor subunit TctC